MALTMYISSVSANMEMKKEQQRIEMVLDAKKIPFTSIDIATEEGAKEKMREITGDPKAFPPQLVRGDEYLGNYAAFDDAVESEALESFLKL